MKDGKMETRQSLLLPHDIADANNVVRGAMLLLVIHNVSLTLYHDPLVRLGAESVVAANTFSFLQHCDSLCY